MKPPFLLFFVWMIFDNRHIFFVFGIVLLTVVITDWFLGMTKVPSNSFVFWTNIICRIACLYFAFIMIPICLCSFSLSMKRAEKDFGNVMRQSLDEKTDGGISKLKQYYSEIAEFFDEKD